MYSIKKEQLIEEIISLNQKLLDLKHEVESENFEVINARVMCLLMINQPNAMELYLYSIKE